MNRTYTQRNNGVNFLSHKDKKVKLSLIKKMIIYILFIYFLLYNIVWFCHTSTCICHRCTRVPHPKPRSHLPPHTIPLGHPSAQAPSFLYPASNLDWRFVSYMILYMFYVVSISSFQRTNF